MPRLKILKAVYYDPNKGERAYLKGTDVTEEFVARIKNDNIIYTGKYNSIFPDHFKNATKKLRVELEFDKKRYHSNFYNEDEPINLREDLNLPQKRRDIKGLFGHWLFQAVVGVIVLGFILYVLQTLSNTYEWPKFLYNTKDNPSVSDKQDNDSRNLRDGAVFIGGDNYGDIITNPINESVSPMPTINTEELEPSKSWKDGLYRTMYKVAVIFTGNYELRNHIAIIPSNFDSMTCANAGGQGSSSKVVSGIVTELSLYANLECYSSEPIEFSENLFILYTPEENR